MSTSGTCFSWHVRPQSEANIRASSAERRRQRGRALRPAVTLDLRTCPICSALDGRVFPLDQGERPAFHPQCRCAVVPVTKSWEELGIRVRKRNRGASQGTRASMNGLVPQNVQFPEWIKGQPHGDLVEVFGRTRANWIRDGRIDPRELIDDRLRIRSIGELRESLGR